MRFVGVPRNVVKLGVSGVRFVGSVKLWVLGVIFVRFVGVPRNVVKLGVSGVIFVRFVAERMLSNLEFLDPYLCDFLGSSGQLWCACVRVRVCMCAQSNTGC